MADRLAALERRVRRTLEQSDIDNSQYEIEQDGTAVVVRPASHFVRVGRVLRGNDFEVTKRRREAPRPNEYRVTFGTFDAPETETLAAAQLLIESDKNNYETLSQVIAGEGTSVSEQDMLDMRIEADGAPYESGAIDALLG